MAGDLFAQGFDLDLAVQMGVALAVGALIGLERERHREARTVLAGIRTYPLVALAGTLFAQLGETLGGNYYVAVGAGVFGGFALVLYWVRHTLGLHGLTSPIALFVTYVAGALIGSGFLLEGVIAGVATAVLLFTKARLHQLAEVMTEEEMAGALQFIVVAFILYPLFTDSPVDPYGIFHPKRVILIVMFVSGVSFASFLVMRTLGAHRGLLVSGMLGGLVNSEATTASLAHVARDRPHLVPQALDGITSTNATMLLRNLLIAAFVFPNLDWVWLLAPALFAMFLVQGVIALRHTHTEKGDGGSVRLGNPFAILPALKFAVIFVVLQAAALGLRHIAGGESAGVLLTAAGGLVSSAAVVASVGSLAATGEVDLDIAALTAVLATIISTLNKLLLARSIHPALEPRLRLRILAPSAVGLAAIATTLWAL